MSRSSTAKTGIFTNKDHTTHISSKLQEFYRQHKFVDVVLVAGTDGVKMEAHRLVLSAASEYIQSLFETSPMARQVELEDIDGATLRTILDFMYTGSIELRSDTVEKVMRAADLFKMDTLVAASCNFMEEQLNPRNCLDIAFLAKEHGCTELHKKSLAFAYQNFEEMSSEEQFLLLDELQLNDFLSGDNLGVVSQEKLFHSLVTWYEHDEPNREKFICSLLLPHVNVALLDKKFIFENRKKLPIITECSELILSWLERHSLLESPKVPKKRLVYLCTEYGYKFQAQTFDAKLNQWSYEDWPSPPKAIRVYGMLIIKNKLIFAGGKLEDHATNKVQYLDLQSMQWSYLPPMLEKRFYPALAELNGEVYVVGGYDRSSNVVLSMEKYNFSAQKWKSLESLPKWTREVKAVVLNGLLYVTGIHESYMQCYNPATNTWSQLSPKNEELTNSGMGAVNGYLYVVGGVDGSGRISKTVERYDPSHKSWTVVNPLKEVLRWTSCVAWNDKLLCCGGESAGESFVKSCEEYNPQTNEWKSFSPILKPNVTRINAYSSDLLIWDAE